MTLEDYLAFVRDTLLWEYVFSDLLPKANMNSAKRNEYCDAILIAQHIAETTKAKLEFSDPNLPTNAHLIELWYDSEMEITKAKDMFNYIIMSADDVGVSVYGNQILFSALWLDIYTEA